MTLEEGGVTLRLTCVDTPGFGDAVDNTDWYVHVVLRKKYLQPHPPNLIQTPFDILFFFKLEPNKFLY